MNYSLRSKYKQLKNSTRKYQNTESKYWHLQTLVNKRNISTIFNQYEMLVLFSDSLIEKDSKWF